MQRLSILLPALATLAFCGFLLLGPDAQASPDATITVTSTADSGPGTLRQTLLDALSGDTINFDPTVFPPGSPATITLSSTLPALATGNITVDGSAAGVIVDGVARGFDCFTVSSNSNGLKGMHIRNCHYGVHLGSAAQSNTIGGSTAAERNVISSNNGGVALSGAGAQGNVVKGNYIGTDPTGTASSANDVGVYISNGAHDNTIGGPGAGDRNVISGNTGIGGYGVYVNGADTRNNVVAGNYIGVDTTGVRDLGNTQGIVFHWAQTNIIGGTTASERNIISGNANGIIIGTSAIGNVVKGNYIGTDATGATALGNSYRGVYIYDGAQGNVVGGSAPDDRNVISGNGWGGVGISGEGTDGNTVAGNYIGTDVTGATPLPNGYQGVYISGGAQDNSVGGIGLGEGNTIAFSADDGVLASGPMTIRNTIRSNSIHSNGYLGIDNSDGGNTELAPPIIDSAGGGVSGHTNPKCYPCTVEVFSDDEDEGRIYQGSAPTNDDATGTWTYNVTLSGPNITATITDASGNTSEFSASVAYSPPAVGGVAELPDIAGSADSRLRNYVALAGGLAAALLALAGAAWYARRRWRRG